MVALFHNKYEMINKKPSRLKYHRTITRSSDAMICHFPETKIATLHGTRFQLIKNVKQN